MTVSLRAVYAIALATALLVAAIWHASSEPWYMAPVMLSAAFVASVLWASMLLSIMGGSWRT